MSSMDDPRDILKAAGAECAEVDTYMEEDQDDALLLPRSYSAVLALARLVAKLSHDLKQSDTFIALLKGMVEQLEDEKHEGFGYNLDDLRKRMNKDKL